MFLLLLGMGYAACNLPLAANSGQATSDLADDLWRRTASGWERSTWQPVRRDLDASSLPHPGLLALGEGLLSLAVMLAWSLTRETD